MKADFVDLHHNRQPVAGAVAEGIDVLMTAARNAVATAYAWNHRRHERRTLADLDDHLLRDIGIDRYQAITEASKPFWRA